jgi:lysyl-tRNA synthetase class 2
MVNWLAGVRVTVSVGSGGGRTQLLLLLAGLICSFLFIRLSVRMIRAQVSWWPGNVQPGGLHIHHVVFGQVMMIVGGVGSFGVRGRPVVHDVLAVVFGLGCGLVLDEFALVLHLEDVYWAEEGRRSVDAVILAVAVIGLLVAGQAPLGGYVGGRSATSYGVAAALLVLVVLCLLKGKVWTGLLGVMVPLLALVGALRLARPGSPWARWRYTSRPRRMARAERREEGLRRRVMVAKTRLMDAVAGAPTLAAPSGPATDAGPALEAPHARESPPAPQAPQTPRTPQTPQEPGTVAAPVPGRAPVQAPPQRLPEPAGASITHPEPAAGPSGRRARRIGLLRAAGAVIAVWYLRAAALVDLTGALVAPLRDRLRSDADGRYVTPLLVSPGFTAAALTFVLAVGLRRRKRAAWRVVAVLAVAYAAAVVVAAAQGRGAAGHPVTWVSLALTFALLAVLLVARPLFDVRVERRNVTAALAGLVVGALVAVGAGTVLVYAADRDPPSQWAPSARYAAVRVLTLTPLVGHPGVRVAWWADLLVNLLSVALFVVALLLFLRAPRGRARLGAAQERRLRTLLRADGQDSLGYLALRRDRSVCWSPRHDAAVVQRVVNGVALASGDPLGPPAAWPAAIGQWLATARRNAWVPAVAHAGPDAAGVYAAAGLRVLPGGREPVLAVGPLPDGPERVRRAMAQAGYRARLRRQRDVPEEEWPGLRRLAAAWRERGRPTDGVELDRLGDPDDPDCVLAECLDPNGRACALLLFAPWGRDGLTLALLRHDRESGRGPVDLALTEVLVRAAAGAAPVAGVVRVSLNLPREAAAGPFAAYRPEEDVRYVLYERRTELPRVLAAAVLTEGLDPALLPRAARAHG